MGAAICSGTVRVCDGCPGLTRKSLWPHEITQRDRLVHTVLLVPRLHCALTLLYPSPLWQGPVRCVCTDTCACCTCSMHITRCAVRVSTPLPRPPPPCLPLPGGEALSAACAQQFDAAVARLREAGGVQVGVGGAGQGGRGAPPCSPSSTPTSFPSLAATPP